MSRCSLNELSCFIELSFGRKVLYTSGLNGAVVAKLSCSTNPDAVCENIQFRNFTITSPCGDDPVIICDGVKGDPGVDCVSANSTIAQEALSKTCTIPQVTIEPPF